METFARGDFSGQKVIFAQRYICKKICLHEGSISHKGSFVHEDTFAPVEKLFSFFVLYYN